MRARHLTGRQIQLFILGASLLAFAGAFLSAGLPRHVNPIQPVRSAPVRLMSSSAGASNDVRYLLADLLDPSLMSLPSRHGFSRDSWERGPAATYEPSDFRMTPATLALAGSLELPELLTETPLSVEVRGNAERALPAAELTDIGPVGTVALDQSVFRITGSLAARTVMHAPKLGLIESPVPLRSAVVRLGVGADGLVDYAMLEASSGDTTVDARALAFAREFRFEPRAEVAIAPTVEWGMVKFLWAFTAPRAAKP